MKILRQNRVIKVKEVSEFELSQAIEIGKILIPFVLSIWPWKKDRKVKVPTTIKKGDQVYTLIIEWRESGNIYINYQVYGTYRKLLPLIDYKSEKEAKKGLYEYLIEHGFLA